MKTDRYLSDERNSEMNTNMMNGGFDYSDDRDCAKIDNEPYICFRLTFGGEYVTTVSQLKNTCKFINGGMMITNTVDGTEPITYYNLWNYDVICSWGKDDHNAKLAEEWFYSKIREEKPDFKY